VSIRAGRDDAGAHRTVVLVVVNTDPRNSAPAPYPAWMYPARALWLLVQATVWKLAWRRLRFLRPAILRLFGARIPYNCNANIFGSVEIHFPWQLSIGKDVSISMHVRLYNLGELSIGDRVVISHDAYFCGGTHDYTSIRYPLLRRPIEVEEDVWIGAGAFIGPGVRIGRGAVVGARAVVVKDVPPWKVVAGNPAKIIKDRVLRDA
jgi:putative colanic acid biosynthesis acetyltransferase WcaF